MAAHKQVRASQSRPAPARGLPPGPAPSPGLAGNGLLFSSGRAESPPPSAPCAGSPARRPVHPSVPAARDLPLFRRLFPSAPSANPQSCLPGYGPGGFQRVPVLPQALCHPDPHLLARSGVPSPGDRDRECLHTSGGGCSPPDSLTRSRSPPTPQRPSHQRRRRSPHHQP